MPQILWLRFFVDIVYIYKKLISRWDRRTLLTNSNYRLSHAIVAKLYHPYTHFFAQRSPIWAANRDVGASWLFIIAPYKYSYLLTYWSVSCYVALFSKHSLSLVWRTWLPVVVLCHCRSLSRSTIAERDRHTRCVSVLSLCLQSVRLILTQN